MGRRKTIQPGLRAAVFTRDYHACRKCGYDEDLQLHHIHPVVARKKREVEGENELSNLITLCSACHREWEILARPPTLTFHQWLDLPSASILVAFFANADLWRDDMTAKAFRDEVLKVSFAVRAANSTDKEVEEQDEPDAN